MTLNQRQVGDGERETVGINFDLSCHLVDVSININVNVKDAWKYLGSEDKFVWTDLFIYVCKGSTK